MGDEQSVMMASSVGTHPSGLMGHQPTDPFKAYAVELGQKDDANILQIVESSLKRYNSEEVDAFVEDIINEVSSYYPDQNTEHKRDELEIKEAEEPLVPDKNVMLHIGARYKYVGILGSGASCRVLKVRDLVNKRLYAVKEMLRSKPLNGLLFAREVRLLKMWKHPNILRFFDCYVDKKCYYIATEYCSGGTLLDKMKKERILTEARAREYVKSILSAVQYIHSQNIVHRDLKAKNVVFTDASPDGVLKVIDFGDAKKIRDHETYTDFACTLHYMPPEILRPRTGRELKKGDLWSTGVMAYLMVCGRPPFTGRDRREIVLNITSEHRKLRWPKNVKISDTFKDFIGGLLTGNVKERMSAKEALDHEWITGKSPETPSLFKMLSENSRSLMNSMTFNLLDIEQTLNLDDFDIAGILDEAERVEEEVEEYENDELVMGHECTYEIKLQAVHEVDVEEDDEEDTQNMRGLVMVNEITGDTTDHLLTPMTDDMMVPTYTSHYSNSAMTTSGQSDDSMASMHTID